MVSVNEVCLMDPIRPRRPSPARELLPGPQPDRVQPTADRGGSACWRPLDGLPARRTVSRTRLPSPLRPRLRSRRAASAICSVRSIRRFLIHRFLIRCLPSARRIQRLPQQSGMRCNRLCVQPMTRHPPCVSLSLPRGSRAPRRPRDDVLRNPPTLRRPRRWIYARLATVSSSKRRSNRMCVRQWRSTTRHWWAMGLHTRTSLRSANTRQR